ncbi:MAG: UDP-N-acetylglucosamine 1-carboxyvinyltransferase [Planctomyces sp.]|nr:UDP-N-acetylglucosamine 1-carboxyvinyltransferase [Planctomyces sp.]MBA4119741.1 UDP-N-acetylglucosamine 1-carboxyvinyltransferase [Isosphaera sp.]
MDRFDINGGRRLAGRLTVKGSKNAALPMLAAALLTDQPVTLTDVPELADIANMRRLLTELGCEAQAVPAADPESPGGAVRLHARDQSRCHARYDIVRTMRASVCVLGPMLALRGQARVSLPGGCAIGERPVDIHLRGLAALGADIVLDQGDIVARVPRAHQKRGRLRGARVFLGGPFGSTVLGTANVMSAATLAEGTTVIESAACEPEIVDLANLLNAMGARVSGQGSPRIVVQGVAELGGADHRVIPDRIEAGTYMCAAAITGGDVTLDNCPVDALMALADRLQEMGLTLRFDPGQDAMRTSCRVTAPAPGSLRPVEVATQPHPGFPTDLQAQLLAVLCLADGNSVITERIFTERFLHVAELSRMGARLYRQGPTVIVSGVRELVGAPVMASDLRASACLVLAGLAARGTTTVNRVYHLDRGYERMEQRLISLGADVTRLSAKDPEPAPQNAGQ